MSKPVVAIVGRPNVGKSTFFNYIVGQRISIVEDTPGVTRDRVYAESNWRGRDFTVIDTAGIEEMTGDTIVDQMREQVDIAISVADVIIFLTDIKQGVTAVDQEISIMLKKSKKPIILVCNKADNFGGDPVELYEFYNLGIGTPIALSAANAIGVGDVLDAIYEKFPDEKEEDNDSEVIKVAVIGKPNVGKSSLINRILGENRVIVSDVAGTTRDAIDSEYENEFGKYIFIDTAGIRQAKDEVEKLLKSNFRPEFLNRLDEIVFYKPLIKDEISKILELLIKDLDRRLEDKQIKLELTQNAKDYLIDNGYDEIYGARPLKRFVQKKLETLIARKIITQEILPNTKVIVDCEKDVLITK